MHEEDELIMYQTKEGEVYLPSNHSYSDFIALYRRLRDPVEEPKNSQEWHSESYDRAILDRLKTVSFETGPRRRKQRFSLPTINILTEKTKNSVYAQLLGEEENGEKLYFTENRKYNWNLYELSILV